MRGDRTSARLSVAVVGAIAIGVAAMVLPYIEAGVRPRIPDSVVGWTLIGSGWVLGDRRPSLAAWLIVASGGAWFIVDLSPVLSGAAREVVEASALGYLALLTHGLLAASAGRADGLFGHLLVAAMYGMAVAAGMGYYRRGLVAAGAAIVVTAIHRWITSHGRLTRSQTASLAALLVLGFGTFLTAVLRLTTQSLSEQAISRVLFLSIVVAAVLVAVVGSTPFIVGSRLDLGIGSVSAFEAAIGSALGREDITVRFPTANGRWVDPSGDFAGIAGDRIQKVRGGTDVDAVVAALGNFAGVAADVPAGVVDVLRLAGARARLHVEVRSRLDELAESRRRLLDAADTERRQLERQLRSGALTHIATIDALVSGTVGLQHLRERVVATQTELDAVARGIDPLAESDLRTALGQVASRSTLPVSINVPAVDLPAPIARAVWYTCSEALTNVSKHAPAASVTISLRDIGAMIMFEVEDDGPGGADPDGWGLRGLADRAEALGGSFSVATDHCGTRITLEVPAFGRG